jgi:T4 bacteriophage base plate protein
MRSLSAHHILQVWEIGQSQHPVDRALTLLSFACPDQTVTQLASFSIGQRDACLLTLREMTFGSQMNSFAECPQCHERLEFTINVADIRIPVVEPQVQEYSLTVEGLELQFRLPNSWDLATIVNFQEVNAASSQLIECCLLQASRDGVTVAYKELPSEAIAKLASQIAEYDPQAEILLDLNCPACNHCWQVLFDIVAFFWTEISTQAKRLLYEVHQLARVYGWREADILSMSAMRRQFYLDLVADD